MAVRYFAILLGDSFPQCQPHGFLLLSRSVLRLPARDQQDGVSQFEMLTAVRPISLLKVWAVSTIIFLLPVAPPAALQYYVW